MKKLAVFILLIISVSIYSVNDNSNKEDETKSLSKDYSDIVNSCAIKRTGIYGTNDKQAYSAIEDELGKLLKRCVQVSQQVCLTMPAFKNQQNEALKKQIMNNCLGSYLESCQNACLINN